MLICEWLPAIVEFGQFSGNWELYLDHIYTIFERDYQSLNLMEQH